MPRNIKLLPLSDPAGYFAANTQETVALTIRAFGGNPATLDDGAKAHFQEAEYGHIILDKDRPIGYMLCRRIGDDILWLHGIMIDRDYQGHGLGAPLLTEAAKGFRVLVAATRNPATVKLVCKVMDITCPDICLPNPLQHLDNVHIRQAMEKFAPHVNVDPATIPFIQDRYPDDLYAADPGRDMPFPFIRQSPKNALMVAGLKL